MLWKVSKDFDVTDIYKESGYRREYIDGLRYSKNFYILIIIYEIREYEINVIHNKKDAETELNIEAEMSTRN